MNEDSAAKFVLAHTTDPEVAARLVEVLGVKATEVKLSVALPAPWVKSKQKANARLAAFACANCDDPATLDEIASTTTRLKVMAAIFDNPHALSSTKELLLTKEGFPPAKRSSRAEYSKEVLDRVTASVNATLAASTYTRKVDGVLEKVFRADYRRLTLSLNRAGIPSSAIDSLYATLYKKAPTETFTSVLLSHCGVESSLMFAPFWWKLSKPLEDLMSSVPAGVLSSALETLLSYITSNGYNNTTSKRIPLAVTTAIMSSFDPGKVKMPVRSASYQKAAFDDESFELLRLSTAWAPLLNYHSPTSRQIAALAGSTSPSGYLDLLSLYAGSPEAVEHLLPLLGPSQVISDPGLLRYILMSIPDDNSPLLGVLYEHVTEELLLGLVFGDWSVNQRYILPTPKEIPHIAARLGSPRLSLVATGLNRLMSHVMVVHYSPRDYIDHIIDVVPGVAQCLLQDSRYSSYIYQRLIATGASPQLIADQLALAPALALDDLCNTLAALARVVK